MIKELPIESLIFLYHGVTQIGINEYLEKLRNKESIDPIGVTLCTHDSKHYVDDGTHRPYVLFHKSDRRIILAEIYKCTDRNWMYGFPDTTCDIRELYGPERYSIKDLIIVPPTLD